MNIKIQILTIILFIFSIKCHGQINESGIYLNVADYKAHKLTYKINCKNEKHTINLYDYWHKPSITLIHNGKKHVYKKSDVFGFKNCNDAVYRFFNDEEYKIEEVNDIIIYTSERTSIAGKGFRKKIDYYFSKYTGGEIFQLDINHLKAAYSKNKKFCTLLETNFQKNDISFYDKLHREFGVNYLFDISIKDN